MKLWQVLSIYNLLLPLALLVGLPGYLIKAIRRGGARDNFAQRFGRYDTEILQRWRQDDEGVDEVESGRLSKRVWIHAVSVGEVLVGMKIIQALLEQDAGRQVVLSTTTPTGYRLANKECPDSVCVIYNPVDLPWVVRGALHRIRPEHLILVEAEVWPNLVSQAKRRGVTVSLVNARLSERSERRFRKSGLLTQPLFGMLDHVCVQFDRDVVRWQGLGVVLEKIHEVGSIKYDEDEQEKPVRQIAEMQFFLKGLGIHSSQPVLLAGSTHAGEEALIGKVYRDLCERLPDLVYIVVPRHVERTAEVVKDLEGLGLNPCLRSEVAEAKEISGGENVSAKGRSLCLLVNTTGELRAWYHLASVVVVGKSWLGKGGQNPVEPLMAGKAVITGPKMGNFTAVMDQLLQAKGLIQVSGAEELYPAIEEILKARCEADLMVERGQAALERHRGAARRTVKVISG